MANTITADERRRDDYEPGWVRGLLSPYEQLEKSGYHLVSHSPEMTIEPPELPQAPETASEEQSYAAGPPGAAISHLRGR